MIPGIQSTPPEVAMALGFFMALALRRSRLEGIVERLIPNGGNDG
jgi:hypothetical protein